MKDQKNPGLELIFARRSIRIFSPGTINAQSVSCLLEAAAAAPSAMTKDPWRFVVARQTASLQQLAEALPGGKMLSTAAMAIVVCGDLNAALDRQLSYLLQDCSAATQNLLLAATALNLGACWVGVHPNENCIRKVRQLLGLPADIIPMAVVALGLPGEQPPPRTRLNPAQVHNEKWQERFENS